MTENKAKALALAKLGLYVFPCRTETETIDGKVYGPKSPLIGSGFLNASTAQEQINRWWKQWPDATVGVACGMSKIVVLDIDVKETTSGWDSLDEEWLEPADTFHYTTIGGKGDHYVYRDPGTKNLAPKVNYRKLKGIDRRSGMSYVVWAGPVPESADQFKTAPDWFLDESNIVTVNEFNGSTKEWFEGLTPGDPNTLVRKAIDRIPADPDHETMVKAQHEAIRLGAEGNPGVPNLLEALETAWLGRPAENHSTPEALWVNEFVRALASGIEKHGAAISLFAEMPPYRLEMVPSTIPDRLVSGDPGDKTTFSQLLGKLVGVVKDDLTTLSILWNAPTTKDLSRDWGLEFVDMRIKKARTTPEPTSENPTLDNPSKAVEKFSILSPDEREYINARPTFIDDYLAATLEAKGWVNDDYAMPSAWTLLSMAYGYRALINLGSPIGLNLWFITLGPSGTGKSGEDFVLKKCLDLFLKQSDETYYNLGANSSPEAMHEALLERDKKPSIVHHDEASDFFDNLKKKDWMASLKDLFAKWYTSYVDPIQKVRLKENRGKSARTSFNIHMLATPDRLLSLVDSSMFETGFLARFNWTWSGPPVDDDMEYLVQRGNTDESGLHPAMYAIASDLIMATRWLPPNPVIVDWTDEAEDRVTLAHRAMDLEAKKRDHYPTTQPIIKRLGKETVWKCAALLALYRGEKMIRLEDALVALKYVEQWYDTLFKVVEAAGEGDFVKDVEQIEAYIKSKPYGVTEPFILNRFKSIIQRSPRELDDRIDFLRRSGRIVREQDGVKVKYQINGSD